MSFFAGLVRGFNRHREAEDQRNYDAQIAKRDQESKIALHLLESDDPDVQLQGMSILQAAMEGPKRKKGIRGSLGEYEDTQGLRPILDLMNRAKARFSSQPATAPQSAALPPASPVEPKAQGAGAVQPSMIDSALYGGGEAYGDQDPNEAAAMGEEGAGAPTEFAGVPLNLPQMFAGDVATKDGTARGINLGQIAGQVSRDRAVAQPGERARLFWPNRASIAASSRTAELMADARVLQSMGATPLEIREALMARMGNPTGAQSATNAGTVKLADGNVVNTFVLRDPRTGTTQHVYQGPGGWVPVPPGSQPHRLPSATGMSVSSTGVRGQQLIDEGIVEAGDVDPNGYYNIKQQGDQIQILPGRPPQPTFPYASMGVDVSGQRVVQDRTGGFSTVPGTGIVQNPRVIAAKQLIDQARRAATIQGMFIPSRFQQQLQALAPSFPGLAGLTPNQIQTLSGLDVNTPEEQINQMLGNQPTPNFTPPPAPATPLSAPGTLTPPPGGNASPGGPAAASALPAGWAKDIVNEIINESQRGKAGTVMGRPPR